MQSGSTKIIYQDNIKLLHLDTLQEYCYSIIYEIKLKNKKISNTDVFKFFENISKIGCTVDNFLEVMYNEIDTTLAPLFIKLTMESTDYPKGKRILVMESGNKRLTE